MGMKTRWIRLILLIFLFAWISSASAANDFSHPMVFSGSPLGPDRCKLITVHSYIEDQGNIYTQSGVGWFILGEQGYRVITPAHVIAGANLVFGECLGELFPMGLQSKSETLDLALLTIPESYSSFAFPMIVLENRNTFLSKVSDPLQRELLNVLNPEHFNEPFDNKMLQQKSNYYLVPDGRSGNSWQRYKSFEMDLIGIGTAHIENDLPSLVVETLAIRPGFSGAPLFIEVPQEFQKPQNYFVGMLTRAEINGSRSLGISLPQILEILPRMLNAANNNLDVYTDAHKLPVRLRYHNLVKNGVMERSQDLIYSPPSGKTFTFTEICDDTTAESSEWGKGTPVQTFSPKSLKDLGLQKLEIAPPKVDKKLLKNLLDLNLKLKAVEQKTAGGDYGEGGGGPRSLKNSKLMTTDPNTTVGANLSSYKKEKTCSKMAVKNDQGKSVDSMIAKNKVVKTTNLTEAFNTLKSNGASWAETMHSGNICESYQLISARRVETYYRYRDQMYTYGRTEGVARAENINASEEQSYLRCRGNQIEIVLSTPILAMNLLLDRAGPGRGSVTLRNNSENCTIQMSKQNYSAANRWKHQIRTHQMDMDINLGTEGRILSIKILRTSKECSPNKNDELWLEEVNFSDQETVNKKFKPRTLIGDTLRSPNERQ